MIYLPILGAFALAGGTIIQRFMLRRKDVSVKQYSVMEFLAIILVALPFIYFFWRVDSPALQTKNIIIFASVIIFSIIANILVYYSVKGEKVSNLEPAKVLEPLFVILLAILLSFFLPQFDNNPKVIIPAIISVAALLFSHIKRDHLNFNKYFIAAIFGSFFFGLELVISKLILDYYNPLTFYFIRGFFILLFFAIFFHPNLKNQKRKTKLTILGLGVIWVIYRIAVYWGYTKLGIISTTMIFMLGPVLVYLFAHIFLKEKLNWKNILASIIIVASVIYTLLI
jgi:drug/metabolite transporter (DMT)-like permease